MPTDLSHLDIISLRPVDAAGLQIRGLATTLNEYSTASAEGAIGVEGIGEVEGIGKAEKIGDVGGPGVVWGVGKSNMTFDLSNRSQDNLNLVRMKGIYLSRQCLEEAT